MLLSFLKEGNYSVMLTHIQRQEVSMGYKPICYFSLFQELSDIREAGVKHFRNIQVDEANMLCWQGLIVPVSAEWVQTKPSNTFNVSGFPSCFFLLFPGLCSL